MRVLILTILLLIIDWFAFQAISVFIPHLQPQLRNAICFVYWIIPFTAISYAFAADRDWTRHWPKPVKVILTSMIFILYLSKLFVGIVIILDDIRRGIAWLIVSVSPETALSAERLPLMSTFGLVIGAIPLLALTYGLIRNPYRYKVFRNNIALPGLPSALEGMRIVQISDIHAGSFIRKERVARSVEIINSLNPDLVFFTGDLVNHSADEVDEYIDVFREIKSKYGIYSVFGNHDYGDYRRWPNMEAKNSNLSKLQDQHRHLGWDLLRNAHRVIEVNGKRIGIIGVENYSAHPRFQKYGDMKKATAGMHDTDLQILLSHDPSHWDDEVLARYPQVDLTLSGHTHGFQFGIELSDWFRWSPVQYIYKRWAGLYRHGYQYLYVNRGLGFLGYPGRVGILPEITLLTMCRDTTH